MTVMMREELRDYMYMTGATAWLCWTGGERWTMTHCTTIAMTVWVQDVSVGKDGHQGGFMVWFHGVAPQGGSIGWFHRVVPRG